MKCTHDPVIPLELRNLENAHVRKVSLPEDITVPPHHELLIPGAVQTPFPTEAVLEPANNMIEKGILIARVIFGPVISQIPVQIINPGSNPVKLYKGTNVGTLHEIEPEYIDCPVEATKVDNGSTVTPTNIGDLSSEQHSKIENLLKEYKDIFSQGVLDLGQTDVVEHKIETGNALPIKQLPRRLPVSLHPVVDKQINDMLAAT